VSLLDVVPIESTVALIAEVGPRDSKLEYDVRRGQLIKNYLLMLYVPLLMVVAVTRIKERLVAYAALVRSFPSMHSVM
jgi:hypothetical protein